MARKIVAVIVQPVHDGDGKVLYQPGDELAEDHKVLKSLPPGTWRHQVVEVEDKPEPAPTPTPALEPEVKRGPGRPRKIEESSARSE